MAGWSSSFYAAAAAALSRWPTIRLLARACQSATAWVLIRPRARQAAEAAVLVRGMDALDQFAPGEDRLRSGGRHPRPPVLDRLRRLRPFVAAVGAARRIERFAASRPAAARRPAPAPADVRPGRRYRRARRSLCRTAPAAARVRSGAPPCPPAGGPNVGFVPLRPASFHLTAAARTKAPWPWVSRFSIVTARACWSAPIVKLTPLGPAAFSPAG